MSVFLDPAPTCETDSSNYEQLGLQFKLFSAEVLFNCGLTKIYLGQVAEGMADLREAQAQKQSPEHAVIDDAVRDQGKDYNVFSVPVGIVFRPAPAKLKNLAARDYMGKAILVAASDANDAYTTFTGITRLRRGQTPTGAPLDASHPLGRSASVSIIDNSSSDRIPAARLARSNTLSVVDQVGQANPSSSSLAPPASNLAPQRTLTPQRSLTTMKPTLPPLQTELSRMRMSPTPPPNGRQPTRQDSYSSAASPQLRTPPQPRAEGSLRVTELYDDYYKEPFENDLPPDLPPIRGRNKDLEAWASKTPAGAPPPLARSNSARPSQANLRAPARAPSRASGNGMTGSIYESEGGSFYDLTKVRIKVHVGKTVRGMSVSPDHTYDDFVDAIRAKFPYLGDAIVVNFRDEDGEMLSMQDEGDYEAAIDVAR